MGSSSRERGTAAPLFGPCLLWPSSPISATAELLLLWPNDWIHQDTTCMEVDLSPQPTRLCVRRGRSPLPKKGRSPQFSARVYCSQTAAWFRMPLGMEVGLSPRDFVLGWDPAPSPKGAEPAKLSAHIYCGQTAGWIKMALGTKIGLSSDNFVLDEDPAPSPKRGGAPNFRPTSIVAKRLHGSRCHLVRR